MTVSQAKLNPNMELKENGESRERLTEEAKKIEKHINLALISIRGKDVTNTCANIFAALKLDAGEENDKILTSPDIDNLINGGLIKNGKEFSDALNKIIKNLPDECTVLVKDFLLELNVKVNDLLNSLNSRGLIEKKLSEYEERINDHDLADYPNKLEDLIIFLEDYVNNTPMEDFSSGIVCLNFAAFEKILNSLDKGISKKIRDKMARNFKDEVTYKIPPKATIIFDDDAGTVTTPNGVILLDEEPPVRVSPPPGEVDIEGVSAKFFEVFFKLMGGEKRDQNRIDRDIYELKKVAKNNTLALALVNFLNAKEKKIIMLKNIFETLNETAENLVDNDEFNKLKQTYAEIIGNSSVDYIFNPQDVNQIKNKILLPLVKRIVRKERENSSNELPEDYLGQLKKMNDLYDEDKKDEKDRKYEKKVIKIAKFIGSFDDKKSFFTTTIDEFKGWTEQQISLLIEEHNNYRAVLDDELIDIFDSTKKIKYLKFTDKLSGLMKDYRFISNGEKISIINEILQLTKDFGGKITKDGELMKDLVIAVQSILPRSSAGGLVELDGIKFLHHMDQLLLEKKKQLKMEILEKYNKNT